MSYINILTGRYPMSAPDVLAENPDKIFPDVFELPDNYAVVQETFPEAYSRHTHVAVELAPKLEDGVYSQVWSIVPIQAEVAEERLARFKSIYTKDIARIRWEKEVGGLPLPNGMVVKTDRESQAQLSSAYTSLKGGLIPDTMWKGENGWVLVTLEDIEPLAQAVAQFVRACFMAEKQHQDAIDTLTLADAINYNVNLGWPV